MKKLTLLLLVIAIAIAGILYFRGDDQNSNPNTSNNNAANQAQPTNMPTPEITDPNVKYYTMEEVRKHGPESWGEDEIDPRYATCWIVIRDKVYEIPDEFMETHPGGHAISEGCGIDATQLFETRPQGSGTPHSPNARQILEKYYIGELKK